MSSPSVRINKKTQMSSLRIPRVIGPSPSGAVRKRIYDDKAAFKAKYGTREKLINLIDSMLASMEKTDEMASLMRRMNRGNMSFDEFRKEGAKIAVEMEKYKHEFEIEEEESFENVVGKDKHVVHGGSSVLAGEESIPQE